MMQLNLFKLEPERVRQDYPQISKLLPNGVQRIELNRGCKRQCSFCYADPNYKTFDIPEMKSNKVQIIGEGFLYDPAIKAKIKACGEIRFNKKMVYYGLVNGIDMRLLTPEIAELLASNRFGVINNKGNWYKGIKFAWDLGLEHTDLVCDTVELLKKNKFNPQFIQVFVLINWKISYQDSLEKLYVLKSLGVKIDDCPWNTTRKEKNPIHWTYEQLKDFRHRARMHNINILFRGKHRVTKDFNSKG